jgi:hypothetical protein
MCRRWRGKGGRAPRPAPCGAVGRALGLTLTRTHREHQRATRLQHVPQHGQRQPRLVNVLEDHGADDQVKPILGGDRGGQRGVSQNDRCTERDTPAAAPTRYCALPRFIPNKRRDAGLIQEGVPVSAVVEPVDVHGTPIQAVGTGSTKPGFAQLVHLVVEPLPIGSAVHLLAGLHPWENR